MSETMETRSMNLGDAIAIATRAHEGQLDKSNSGPYLRHPICVMLALEPYGLEAQMIGILHDVVEDSPDNPCGAITLDDLRNLGASETVVTGVESVTKRAGENYRDLIKRAGQHSVGCIVKLADNLHNSNSDRLSQFRPEDANYYDQKYESARVQLVADNPWLAGHIEPMRQRIAKIERSLNVIS